MTQSISYSKTHEVNVFLISEVFRGREGGGLCSIGAV